MSEAKSGAFMVFRLSLGKRSVGLGIGIGLGIFSVATCTYWGIKRTQEEYENVARGVLEDVIAIDSAFLNFKQTRITLRTLSISSVTSEQQEHTIAQILLSIKAVDEDLKKIHRDSKIPGEAELIANLDRSWDQFKHTGRKMMAYHEEGTHGSKVKLNFMLFRECPDAAAEFMKNVDALRNFLTLKHQRPRGLFDD